ncbi:hypothetical protein pb186bvf_016469 [Paramecium bursaria]
MNQGKSSFFDDLRLPLYVKNILNVHEAEIQGPLTVIGKKGPKERTFYLVDDKLVRAKKYIPLGNMVLEKVKSNGFRLTRNSQSIDFVAANEQSLNLWYEYLKQYCVQRGFKQLYTVNKLIGKGNFAKVYSAQRKSDQQIFAVKAFDKLKFQDIKVDKPALVKELSIMRKMDFRGVIRLYEVFENECYIFLVCEMLDGGELFNYMKNNKGYEEKTVANVIYRILQSIQYIHSKGVLHRDIKVSFQKVQINQPENLILRTKNDLNDVVIADFGLADYYREDGEYMFKRCGTPGYVAPELLQDKIYDYKVDIFSAGVLMFILLSGSSPFRANSYDEIVMKNYQCDVDYSLLNKKEISQEGRDLLHDLLEKVPQQRVTAEIAMKHPWFERNANTQLFLDGMFPRHNKHGGELYAKTPLMGQELSLSVSSTPQLTPQIRSKSNTGDIYQVQNEDLKAQVRITSQSMKSQVQPISEECDYNINDEDENPQGQQIKKYQILPKLKRPEDSQYNRLEAQKIRDNLQTKLL